ncbi:tripartite tricarboxylate transporter TctB family protein [Nesterenkonia aerolata]|uniref:Tripartite tricarboxylate transporter TctB family protein n=1 Tax=Nesterenkonia aerolata TaxID=3074079 RepID=A0ABU2DTX0_9MICC|nr:tripartite tricarboxylate transporter TctB family protein [Nesterenkonia sp. LY-0111]MDR8019948.1 tripartite tricarboxylate transporter TctB family protein [Nesterenkonia sp. LY-0111]
MKSGDTERTSAASLLSDRIIAAVMVVLGVVLLILAFGFPEPGQPEDPGTGALPQLIGFALVVLGVMLLFNAERHVIAPEPGSRLRTALMVLAGLGYTLLLGPLGFVLATVLFMVVGMLIMGIGRVVRLIAVPIVVALAVYYLFTAALGVYLPPGLIEGVLP